MIKSLCYVLGCEDATVIGARHKRFGLVAACGSHNPLKHAYAAPLLNGSPAPAAQPTEHAEPTAGGSRVPLTPYPIGPSSPEYADVSF